MATLFDVNVPAISKHLKNNFESGELKDDSVVSKMEITASDGKHYRQSCLFGEFIRNRTTRTTLPCNLLLISPISVGLWLIIVLLWHYSDPTEVFLMELFWL